MKSYNGCVFFVDMLGVSKLTLGEFQISENDYLPWAGECEFNGNSSLSFVLYKEFQNLIRTTARKHKLQIHLLSDNAFVWSKNTVRVVKCCAEFMQKAAIKGLLCRGGLGYGGIIEEISENNQILLGDAVTSAVKLEAKAKGMRVLMNQDIPSEVHSNNDIFSYRYQKYLFKPFVNPLDFETYDEFKWYMIPFRDLNRYSASCNLTNAEKISAAIERQRIVNSLVLSPKYSWNCLTKDGLIQVKTTIRFITESCKCEMPPNKHLSEHVDVRNAALLKQWNVIVSDVKNYAPPL